MRIHRSCNLQWFLSAVILLFCDRIALSEVLPTVNNVIEPLIDAVKEDDNEAYRAARSAALKLEDGKFDTLLEVLAKADTWQALAVKNGLRIRRKNPNLAAKFDETVDWVRNNPVLTASGAHRFQGEKFREKFDTAEGDWLRYEAVLTEKVDFPKNVRGVAGWVEFRRTVFRSGTRNRGNIRIWVRMYQDKPEWIQWHEIIRWFPHVARRSAGEVDEYVPELLKIYTRFHLKRPDAWTPDRWRPTSLKHERRNRTRAYIDLLQAIAEANTPIALPALKQIREFEETIRRDIQTQASALQVRMQDVEKFREQALREGREEDARKLVLERDELQARDVVALDDSQLKAIRKELDELIEKHQKAMKQ